MREIQKYKNLFKKFPSLKLISEPSLNPLTMCYKGFLGGKGKSAPQIFFGDFQNKWDFFALYFLYEIQHLKGIGDDLEIFSNHNPKAAYFKNIFCWYKALYDLKYGRYKKSKFISGYKLTLQMFQNLKETLKKEMNLENPQTNSFFSKSQIKKDKSSKPFIPKENEFPFNLYPAITTFYDPIMEYPYHMSCSGSLGGKNLEIYYGNFFQRKDLFYLAFFHELGHLKGAGNLPKNIFPQELEKLEKSCSNNLLMKYSDNIWKIYNFFEEYFCWMDALKTLKFVHHISLPKLTFPYIKYSLNSYLH